MAHVNSVHVDSSELTCRPIGLLLVVLHVSIVIGPILVTAVLVYSINRRRSWLAFEHNKKLAQVHVPHAGRLSNPPKTDAKYGANSAFGPKLFEC